MDDNVRYNVAMIGQLLRAAFTADTLRRFCEERAEFQELVAEFSPQHGLAEMVDRVIVYCRTHWLWDELLTEIQVVNPRQYTRFEGNLALDEPSKESPRQVIEWRESGRAAEARGTTHPSRMKDQTPTKKDKLAKMKRISFTGRLGEIEVFRSLLPVGQQTPADILLIYGIGGIGKSSLLDEYGHICRTDNIPFARVDGQEERTILGILTSLHEQLQSEMEFSCFGDGLRRYKEIQAELASHSDIPDRVIALLSKAMAIGASSIPGLDVVVTALGEDTIKAAINKIYSSLPRKQDADFFLYPEGELAGRFLSDLNDFAAVRRIVVMFDTYEAMEALDDWVCRGFFAHLAEHVLVVVAGRYDLREDVWGDFRPLMIRRELRAFDDVEAEEFLCKQGIADSDLVNQMVWFARGHPLALSLLTDFVLRMKVTDLPKATQWRNVVRTLVARMTGDSADSGLRSVIEACCVLRRFTEDSLAHVLETEDVSLIFERMREFSFVRIRNGGLAIHDIVRELVIEDLRWRAPERHLMLHTRAMRFYEGLANRAISGYRHNAGLLELIYHAIQIDEQTGVDLFRQEFERAWCLHQFDTCHVLVADLSQQELQLDTSRHWLLTCKGHLLFYRSKWQELDNLFDDLLAAPNLDKNIHALSSALLGTAHYRRGDLASAYPLLERARELKEDLGELEGLSEVYLTLGKIQRLRGDWDQVLDLWTASLEVARKVDSLADIAWASFNLAFLCSLRRDVGRAESLYMESLEKMASIKDQYGEARALSGLGEVSLLKNDPVTALRYHQRAVAILEKMPDELTLGVVYRRMGDTYSEMGDDEAAEQCYHVAITKSEQLQAQPYMGVAYLKYANHLLKSGRLEAAQEFYRQSEGLVGKDVSGDYQDAYHTGELYRSKASLCRRLGQPRNARAFLEESITIMNRLGCTEVVDSYRKELENLSIDDNSEGEPNG